MILPSVGIGVATQAVTAGTAMNWFTRLLLVMLAGVAALFRHSATSARSAN
ncbi:hypothetical protein [Micromonospora ureilytica]|uniref:hypothetical protein n=1 Tax=Micromonospora ureilytica TaxID=709868 RepID=UPI00403976A7